MRAFKIFGVFFIITIVKALFVFSCIATMSDAQGGLAFVVTAPLMIAFDFGAIFMASKLNPADRPIRPILKWLAAIQLIFVALFLICAFIPALQPFPQAIMGMIGKLFEQIYGKTPYLWAHPSDPF